MRRTILTALLVLFSLGGCRLSPHGGPAFIWSNWDRRHIPRVSGGDGSSYRKAAVIKHSPTRVYTSGLQENWLQERKIRLKEGTGLSRESGRVGERVYDIVTVTTASGETKTFYFDVTHTNLER
jgi:hypothetical protein